MNKEFLDAFADLKKEKNLSEEEIIGAIKDSIENAYKKNYGASNVRVEVDMENGEVTVLMGLEVVEEVEDDLTQISLEEAKEEFANCVKYADKEAQEESEQCIAPYWHTYSLDALEVNEDGEEEYIERLDSFTSKTYKRGIEL